jgi:hypothetical protein
MGAGQPSPFASWDWDSASPPLDEQCQPAPRSADCGTAWLSATHTPPILDYLASSCNIAFETDICCATMTTPHTARIRLKFLLSQPEWDIDVSLFDLQPGTLSDIGSLIAQKDASDMSAGPTGCQSA